VSASADPNQSATQARQQALDRALPEAVYQEALRLLSPQPTGPRAAALRAYLAPHAIDYVQSYQEAAAAQPAPASPGAADEAPQPAPAAPASQSLTLELEVTIQRTYLRNTLTRLGFFAGARHPGAYALRLGPGVKEKDVTPLAQEDVLLGLSRLRQAAPAAQPAPGAAQTAGRVEVTLERLPQGYCKAVLRHGDLILAADAPDLPALWLEIWGRYFTDARVQPGPGQQVLAISGFAGVDAVQAFLGTLATWDDALLEPSLSGLDIAPDGVSARFTCRVTSQEALDAHLREVLPALKLSLAGQTGVGAP
jgi:hypothetical protein